MLVNTDNKIADGGQASGQAWIIMVCVCFFAPQKLGGGGGGGAPGRVHVAEGWDGTRINWTVHFCSLIRPSIGL